MFLRIRPACVCLLVAAVLGTLSGSQRRVVVSSTDDQDLRRTGYRLGLGVERIKEARHALYLATALVPDIAGRASVAGLGDSWVTIHPSKGSESLKSLIDQLRGLAERAEDRSFYSRVTTDARNLKVSLLLLDPDSGQQAMKDWPEPEEQDAEQSSSGSSTLGRADYASFRQLTQSDLDTALHDLPEWEQGQVNPELRDTLLRALEERGRAEDARALALQYLEEVQGLQDESAFSALQSLLNYFAGAGSTVFNEHLPEWVRLLQDLPESSLEGPRGRNHLLPEMSSWTPLERRLIWMLHSVHYRNSGAVQSVLEQFPEFKVKLEQYGGFSGWVDAFREAQRTQQLELLEARRRQEISSPGATGTGAHPQDPEEVRREINRLVVLASRSSRLKPDSARKSLIAAAQLLPRLDEPLAAVLFHNRIARTYLQSEGELTPQLVEQGWDLLDTADAELSSSQDGREAGTMDQQIEQSCLWLYTAWLWSDFGEAVKVVRELDDEFQFEVLSKLLEWVMSGSEHGPHHSFR